ncbi:MAG: 3D domain-containing protein [Candidatus Pacebacteria bacterium]|nr:3D domain-containing protein [Candidatus Paceibacterota bacterium]
MITDLKCPGSPSRRTVISRVLTGLSGLNILAILIFVEVLIGILLIFEPEAKSAEANLVEIKEDKSSSSPFAGAREAEIKEISHALEKRLPFLQENSLLPISSPSNPEFQLTQKIEVVVTAYSSTVDQTDSDPFITAAGTWVKEGIVANNLLPFGTEIRIPEIYGEKIFVVEDRMSWKKGEYHIDIWFPSYWEALNFGTKKTYIEILES